MTLRCAALFAAFACVQAVEEAEKARKAVADAEGNVGKDAAHGDSTGNAHSEAVGIDRDVARKIDTFVQAVHDAEPLTKPVKTALVARRKSALDRATSSAFAAFRYLRAGVEGLMGRVKAAGLRTPPPEVVEAQLAVKSAADLQQDMQSKPQVGGAVASVAHNRVGGEATKATNSQRGLGFCFVFHVKCQGAERDGIAREFIACLPNVQRTAAKATKVLNKRDTSVVKAASALLDDCQHDVDTMKARNAVSGKPCVTPTPLHRHPLKSWRMVAVLICLGCLVLTALVRDAVRCTHRYDEATKLVDAAAALLASCRAAKDQVTGSSTSDQMIRVRVCVCVCVLCNGPCVWWTQSWSA